VARCSTIFYQVYKIILRSVQSFLQTRIALFRAQFSANTAKPWFIKLVLMSMSRLVGTDIMHAGDAAFPFYRLSVMPMMRIAKGWFGVATRVVRREYHWGSGRFIAKFVCTASAIAVVEVFFKPTERGISRLVNIGDAIAASNSFLQPTKTRISRPVIVGGAVVAGNAFFEPTEQGISRLANIGDALVASTTFLQSNEMRI